MKYALIGCGRIAPNHIKAALAAKGQELEISAICDLLPEKAEALAARFELGSVPRYTDYKKMLAEVSPELVAVATESGSHAAVALDCIAAGCNVIIEKPIALSLSDARRASLSAPTTRTASTVRSWRRVRRSTQAGWAGSCTAVFMSYGDATATITPPATGAAHGAPTAAR